MECLISRMSNGVSECCDVERLERVTVISNIQVFKGGKYVSDSLSGYRGYRIMQIVRGGKLSWFSQISLQLQKFSSEFFSFLL